jgi:SAM-dependent methyltransferase
MDERKTQSISSFVRATGKLPVLKSIFYHPAVRAKVQTWPGLKKIYGAGGWDYLHPYDRILGTDTSGFVAAEYLPSSPLDSQKKHCYAGSQPSIIHAALTTLPALDGYTFIDLGCGKGRPLLVSSEFPFRELIGVELSPKLADMAHKNAAVLKSHFPERPPITIVTGDASAFPFPAGNIVLFLYNPFGEEVIAKVVAGIEAALAAENRALFVVYYNPVYGHCFDATPALARYFAASLPYAEEEVGFGPDTEDPVVIWQAGQIARPHPGANRAIVVTKAAMRAEISSLEGQPPA